MRVGFVGAGRMGRPMVERLVAAGHEVRVLGRTPEACKALREIGATPVDSAVAVAAATDAGAAAPTQTPGTGTGTGDADVVCVCVFSDEQVKEVCLAGGLLDAMPDGSVLVVHTTGSPATVRALEKEARPSVGVIDCPVSGGPHNIAAGAITLFAGGAAGRLEHARPVLEAYGDPILHAGPLGAGQALKLVNNAVFAANIGLLAQAVRLGAQLGIDEKDLLNALPHGSAASRALESAARAGSIATFAAVVDEFLSKDIAVVRSAAAGLGADLGVLDDAIRALSDASAARD